mmetsp:Transcript_45269/g.107334  ORF Transcript_45269/g.107334 Transcript_45269/m.107334 type:complete len:222 (+) Transcript_45269:67-732(+)
MTRNKIAGNCMQPSREASATHTPDSSRTIARPSPSPPAPSRLGLSQPPSQLRKHPEKSVWCMGHQSSEGGLPSHAQTRGAVGSNRSPASTGHRTQISEQWSVSRRIPKEEFRTEILAATIGRDPGSPVSTRFEIPKTKKTSTQLRSAHRKKELYDAGVGVPRQERGAAPKMQRATLELQAQKSKLARKSKSNQTTKSQIPSLSCYISGYCLSLLLGTDSHR